MLDVVFDDGRIGKEQMKKRTHLPLINLCQNMYYFHLWRCHRYVTVYYFYMDITFFLTQKINILFF